jgi:deoxycytidylate deaminase
VVGDSRHAPLRALTDGAPDRHDLFVGMVAPIGSDRDQVLSALSAQLAQYGYEIERVRLADLLDDAPGRSGDPLPRRGERHYHSERMNAGDDLRRQTGDDSAVAALAIARVARLREARAGLGDEGADVQPVLYVFDSLKHPREARLLRNVYGPGFWLVSIVQDIDERRQNLADTLASQQGAFNGQDDPELAALIRRDEGDPADKSGQQVRDVFADADYFLPVQRGVQWTDHLERFVAGVFDAPFITPVRDEDAMRLAKIASLRSAALGRQVGAVVIPPSGDPCLLGTNEVPKPGGGQFQEGDVPDFRDFQTGYDPNPMYVDRLLGEVFERLAAADFFTEDRNAAGGAAVLKEALANRDGQSPVLDGIRATSLIEFTRCLHAEQAAIVSAARTGVAMAGSTLYTTTFPCHECTKIIVGAGIIEVQYIEPYPKSMASVLYRDLIDAVPPMQRTDGVTGADLERVPFRPFLGFGPGRYDEVFIAGRRRDGTRAAEHNKLQACPIGRGWSAVAVKDKEDEVVVALKLASDQPTPVPATGLEDVTIESAGDSGGQVVG